jgi:hypothetical protein
LVNEVQSQMGRGIAGHAAGTPAANAPFENAGVFGRQLPRALCKAARLRPRQSLDLVGTGSRSTAQSILNHDPDPRYRLDFHQSN